MKLLIKMADIRDAYGNPIQLTDEHGYPVQLTDEHGNPVHITGIATSNAPISTTVDVPATGLLASTHHDAGLGNKGTGTGTHTVEHYEEQHKVGPAPVAPVPVPEPVHHNEAVRRRFTGLAVPAPAL